MAVKKKRNENLNTALHKFAFAPNMLTITDIKALVNSSQKKNDSPVKQRKADLMKQLYSEPWYSRIQMMAGKLRPTTLTPEDDPTNVMNDDPAAVSTDDPTTPTADPTAIVTAAEALVLVAYQAV